MFKAFLDGQRFYDDQTENGGLAGLKLALEENKAGSFKFTIYPAHPFFTAFAKLKSYVEVYQRDKLIFRGRVIESEETFEKARTITCEGELAFFNDSVVAPYGYQNDEGSTKETAVSVFTKILASHNAQVDDKRKFTLGSVSVPNADLQIPYAQMAWEKSMDAVAKMLKAFGGRLEFRRQDDKTFIDWKDSYSEAAQEVRFGENLLDLTQNVQGGDIITGILPTGNLNEETGYPTNISLMTIPDTDLHQQIGTYIVNKPLFREYGAIIAQKSYDGYPADWIDRVLSDVDGLTGLQDTIEAKAVDLAWLSEFDPFSLGKRVKIISSPHGIEGYFNLLKMEIDLQNPENNNLTFGKVVDDFVEKIVKPGEKEIQASEKKPRRYEYAYANGDSNQIHPDDSLFGHDVQPVEGQYYWTRITTFFSDGSSENNYFVSALTPVKKNYKIRASQPEVIRNDRLPINQQIVFWAVIEGYPEPHPNWSFNGEVTAEGSPILVNVPYLNAGPLSASLFDGDQLMDTMELPVVDQTGGPMYLGPYDSNTPSEAYADDGSALLLLKGDYFLCTGNFGVYEAGNPYVYDGEGNWAKPEISGPDKNISPESFGEIMSHCLDDALSSDTLQNTKFMSWFKRLAAKEAFLRFLNVYNLRAGSGDENTGFLFEVADTDIEGNKLERPVFRCLYQGRNLFSIDSFRKQVVIGDFFNTGGLIWDAQLNQMLLKGAGVFQGQLDTITIKTIMGGDTLFPRGDANNLHDFFSFIDDDESKLQNGFSCDGDMGASRTAREISGYQLKEYRHQWYEDWVDLGHWYIGCSGCVWNMSITVTDNNGNQWIYTDRKTAYVRNTNARGRGFPDISYPPFPPAPENAFQFVSMLQHAEDPDYLEHGDPIRLMEDSQEDEHFSGIGLALNFPHSIAHFAIRDSTRERLYIENLPTDRPAEPNRVYRNGNQLCIS